VLEGGAETCQAVERHGLAPRPDQRLHVEFGGRTAPDRLAVRLFGFRPTNRPRTRTRHASPRALAYHENKESTSGVQGQRGIPINRQKGVLKRSRVNCPSNFD